MALQLNNYIPGGYMEKEIRENYGIINELYDRYVQAFSDAHQTAPLELDEFEQMFWGNEPLQKIMLDDKRKKKEYKKFQEAMTKVSKRVIKKNKKLIKKGEAELLW